MIVDTFVSVDGDGRDSDPTDPGDWSSANQCGFGQPARNSSWHGTHVAGTVAAVTNNSTGVAGVAYGAKVVPVRVLGRCGGYTSDIADGIIWASGGTVSGVPANANPADALNLSLGGGGSCPSTTQSAINTARANGATVVVSAGNSNANAANYTPASCAGVISVAATDRNGSKSYYSNFGAAVDLAAPGGDVTTGAQNGVLSTLNSGNTSPGSDNYEFYQGTSMSAPHIAGLAALMRSVDPSLTPDQIESTMKSTARAFPGTCSQCGSGIADAAAAIAAVSGGPPPPPPPPPPGSTPLTNGVPESGLWPPRWVKNSCLRSRYPKTPSTCPSRSAVARAMPTSTCASAQNRRPAPTTAVHSSAAITRHAASRLLRPAPTTSWCAHTRRSRGSPSSAVTTNPAAQAAPSSRTTCQHRGAPGCATQSNVPAGMSSLTVNISGGSGDADLYVRYGSQPGTALVRLPSLPERQQRDLHLQ